MMEIRHIKAHSSSTAFEETLQTLLKEIYEQDFEVIDIKYQYAFSPGTGQNRYSALVMFEHKTARSPKPI
jgi:hypothetical protein